MSLRFKVENAQKLWRVIQHVNNIRLKVYSYFRIILCEKNES